MRLRKYYDAYRSNKSFLKASLSQKSKIILNILKFLKTNSNKPLIVKNKPVIAQIEPTSLCNLKCKMCVREKTGMVIGSMKFEDFKEILNKLDCLFKLHLSGQGEPFMNPEIFKMIDYANKKGINVFFTTNATLLTKEVIDKISELDIGEIGISIDSTNSKKYESIRKGANLEKVKENIKNLVKKIEEKGKRTIVSTSAVLLKENIEEIPSFIILAKELGIKKVAFQKMQEKRDYLEKYSAYAAGQKIDCHEIASKINEAKKIANENKISLIFDEEKSTGCIWPWRSIYITWNGNVTPCCKILNDSLGNILKEDLWSIWNGERYQEYRKMLKERKSPNNCIGCSMI